MSKKSYKRPNFEQILKFIEFTNEFEKVERIILKKRDDRLENDSEHIFQMCLFAWYLMEAFELSLDHEKVLKYCLAHDLVEAYAGDTYIYDKQKNLDKKEREEKAAKQIRDNFSEFKSIYDWIENYEDQVDEESKYVYALDKLLPIYNIYLDNGRMWKVKEVEFAWVDENKREKVKANELIYKLYDELHKVLESEKDKLFSK